MWFDCRDNIARLETHEPASSENLDFALRNLWRVLLALPAGRGGMTIADSGDFQLFTATGLDLWLSSTNIVISKTIAYN